MPLTRRQTLDELTKLGHRPRQQLGQNYLVDGNIVKKSVELAEILPGDRVVEVGPGLGTLTRSLLESGARVWAVEFDPQMVGYLEREVAGNAGELFQLMQGDAVEFPTAAIPPTEAEAGFKVVANLPYAISTPWMDAILRGPLPARMVLMLQKETADRFAASPGSKKFGAISIFLQSAFEIRRGHAVSRSCFHPPPEVDSFLINLHLRPTPFRFGDQTRQLIRDLFQQRRKQIGSLFRRIDVPRASAWLERLEQLGGSTRARPEELPLAAWQELELTLRRSTEDRL